MKVFVEGKNKSNERIILFIKSQANDTFLVGIEKENYQCGKIVKTIRVVTPNPKMSFLEVNKMTQEGMSFEDAESLYNKNVKDKYKI